MSCNCKHFLKLTFLDSKVTSNTIPVSEDSTGNKATLCISS